VKEAWRAQRKNHRKNKERNAASNLCLKDPVRVSGGEKDREGEYWTLTEEGPELGRETISGRGGNERGSMMGTKVAILRYNVLRTRGDGEGGVGYVKEYS